MTITPTNDTVTYTDHAGNASDAALVVAQPPGILLTGTTNPRLRVDVAETGFFEGREFRIFRQFNLTAAATQTIRIVVPVNAILSGLSVSLASGHVTLDTYAGGTTAGTFGETIPIFPRNTMTDRPTPLYQPQVVMTTGGTVSGGVRLDALELKTDSNSNRAASVGDTVGDARGVGPGTYYYVLTAIDASIGTLHARWEERP